MSSFADRRSTLSLEAVETGEIFAPKFDDKGVLPVVTTDAASGEVIMLAYMNEEALKQTIETGVAHYWSRSRQSLWRKGETSGNTQKVVEIRTDCDQDAIWLKVTMGGTGASCHLGYRSCFFRSVPVGQNAGDGDIALDFGGNTRMFDPDEVYGKG